MKLSLLRIAGFRCYGPDPISIRFADLTACVGSNGSGKTAALVALLRMFGTSSALRGLTREDFHLEPGVVDPVQLSLSIEAHFEFAELLEDAAAQSSAAVPECLRHILAAAAGGVPVCRIRLRGTWKKTPSADGDVEQFLEWLDTMEESPPDDSVHSLHPWERSLIQVFYVPASRDAARELRFASGTLLTRALALVDWSQATRDRIVALTKEVTGGLRAEEGFAAFESHLKTYWGNLYGERLGKPELSLAEGDLSTVLRHLDARLVGGAGELPIALLSEGERSLLYFALVVAALRFEAECIAKNDEVPTKSVPVLTILAVEEPENHLAPYYLARILKNLRAVEKAQIALTSHSASILRRVKPEEVRHFRIADGRRRSVSEVALPVDDVEALKYVREAVQAHPEVYFASAVVLGEGASEEVVLPRIARAFDVDVDPRFVAVVPLGGRHVQHMWRLLRALGTPHATLVDLDNERHGGGWMRLRDLANHLIKTGESPEAVRGELSEVDFEAMRTWPATAISDPKLGRFIEHLEQRFNVFLSAPLDLDMACLEAVSATYKEVIPPRHGPRVPRDPARRARYLSEAAVAVLGEGLLKTADIPDEAEEAVDAEEEDVDEQPELGATYPDELRQLFPLYRYLFLSGSKPVAHAQALARLDDRALAERCPQVLKRLVLRIKALAEAAHG